MIEIAMWASEPVPFDPMEMALHKSTRIPRNVSPTKFHMVHGISGWQTTEMTHVFRQCWRAYHRLQGALERVLRQPH